MKANGREDEVSIIVQNSLYYEEEIVINSIFNHGCAGLGTNV